MSQLLRRGDRGAEVTAWCARLRELGHDPGPETGEFGAAVDEATRAFQRRAGVKADGIVGPITRAAAQVHAPTQDTREIPKAATPLSEDDLRRVLLDGHKIAFGHEPTPERLACAWAQCALEHARGRAVFNNNIGNVSAFGGWPGHHYVIPCQERVSKNPDRWELKRMRFRAHATPQEGAADYWRLLEKRYASALALFDAGNPRGAALELGRLNYYTAHESTYAASMTGLYVEAMRRNRGQ